MAKKAMNQKHSEEVSTTRSGYCHSVDMVKATGSNQAVSTSYTTTARFLAPDSTQAPFTREMELLTLENRYLKAKIAYLEAQL